MLGHVRARVLVVVVVLSLLFGTSLVVLSAAPVRGVAAVTVQDARGRFVGTVLDPFSPPVIVVRVGSTPVALSVLPNEFASGGNTSNSIIQYKGDDCTGETLAGGFGDSTMLFPPILLNGQRLWQFSGPMQEGVVYRSYREIDGTSCVQVGPTPDNAAPVIELADLRSEFQAPFTLRFVGP